MTVVRFDLVLLIERLKMAETDVLSDLGSTSNDEHIFDAINVIRYKKRKR